GLLAAGGKVAPTSLQRALSAWMYYAWGVWVIAGGLTLSVGLLARGRLGRPRARDLERAGSYLLAGATSPYASVPLLTAWPRSVVPGGFLLAIAAASLIYGVTRHPAIWTRLLLRQIEAEARSRTEA